MYETMALDSKTIIVKAETEEKLSEIIDFITSRDKESSVKSLLDFAASKRKAVKNYRFAREECYAE